ncbi:hypothetical protein [uncultured Massilia sp.]|uniref:hypothetical protein n=1 Tax=uncultured Massilia sp. TaxID=169973 RepID=UPI0025E4A592|nr:hypothetical protein [uncultured Massilia sp.]
MNLVRTVKLLRRQKDKVVHCEIELCASPGLPERYLVNVRQGRMGEEWRESTRTPQPVALAAAQQLFDQALEAKHAQGFVAPSAMPSPTVEVPVPAPPVPTEADRTLLQRLERGSWRALSDARRKRTIWRIGERRLRAAVPVLVEQLERGDALQDYCIAWAIGRCGDPGARAAMRELHARSPSDAVRRVARQAWLLLADAEERHDHAQALVAAWPATLRASWDAGDDAAMLAVAIGGAGWAGLAPDAWLEQLDQVAQDPSMAARARPLLLEALRRAPLRPGIFRAVRHIYKMAEMRADATLFALLQRRFEATPHMGEWEVPHPHHYLFAREAAHPDSTVAYGMRTRAYLLRRGWRTLRRLGMDGDPDFVPLALAVLADYDDRDAGKSYARRGRWVDRYGHWPLFNHLLRERAGLSHSPSGLTWYGDAGSAADRRMEAFPEIWDRHPDALLALLLQSRCEGVHVFAARALADNAAWCAGLDVDTLRALLRSPFEASARFAFAVARRRFEPGRPDASWLLLFIQSPLPDAVQYALDCIAQDPGAYAGATALVVAMLASPRQAVRREAMLLCQAALALPGQPEAIVAALLDWLDDSADLDALPDAVPAIAADLARVLELPLRTAAAQAPFTRLLHLLGHPLAAVRVLAGHWLLQAGAAAALPPAQLTALLRDPDAAVRALGVRLFGALPDHVLAQQLDLVTGFACAPDAAVRGAIAPVVARLGADPTLRAALLAPLFDALFRSETGDGMHADLLAWVTGPLGQDPLLADPDLLRRLLAARSKGAQMLGAALIARFAPAQFEVADWAAFGRNPGIAVRRWAYAAFEADPDRARTRLEAALRLFDSKFDDTRAFAVDYFGRICTRADWTPLVLLTLCDHPDAAAQRFGRAMLTAHADAADMAELVLKLGQHPSPAMQLFVSAWLEDACGGDVARLRRLEPYFLAVLSQVHRGRAVKQRVQAFLRAQAMLSADIGAFVAQLFARQVVTMAIGDKAHYIDSLRAIQARHPQLPAVLDIQAPPTLAPTRPRP